MALADAVAEVLADAEGILADHDKTPQTSEMLAYALLSFTQQLRICLKAADGLNGLLPATACSSPWVEIERAKTLLRQQKTENDAQVPVEESPPENHDLLDVLQGNTVVDRLAVPWNVETGHRWTDPASGTVYRVRQIAGNARRFLRLDPESAKVVSTQ